MGQNIFLSVENVNAREWKKKRNIFPTTFDSEHNKHEKCECNQSFHNELFWSVLFIVQMNWLVHVAKWPNVREMPFNCADGRKEQLKINELQLGIYVSKSTGRLWFSLVESAYKPIGIFEINSQQYSGSATHSNGTNQHQTIHSTAETEGT